MPFYRFGDGLMHIKMTNTKKHPAPASCCAPHKWPDGTTRRCCAIAAALCDFEMPEGGTCSEPMCADHQLEVEPGRDLCWRHRPQPPDGSSG